MTCPKEPLEKIKMSYQSLVTVEMEDLPAFRRQFELRGKKIPYKISESLSKNGP